MRTAPIDDIRTMVGTELGVSEWVMMDQARIDAFGHATEDLNAVHMDAEVGREWGLGGTIAHGFLTLSMILKLQDDVVPKPENMTHGFNYGIDKVRFVAPVPSGRRIRGRFFLESLQERKAGEWLFVINVTIEIEGQEKPALVGQWLSLCAIAA